MMEFPGRIYIRSEDDLRSVEHQAMVQKWIGEFEKISRQSFVFPEKHIRSFGYVFIVIGLLLMIIQVLSSCFVSFFSIHVFLVCDRLRYRLFNMFTFQVFSVREFGLDCFVLRQALQEFMQPKKRAIKSGRTFKSLQS